MTTTNIIKRLFSVGMKFRVSFIVVFIISILSALVSVYRPILTSKIVDDYIIKQKNYDLLLEGVGILALVVLAETVLNFFLVYLSSFIAQSAISDIRKRLYNKLVYFKTSYFDKTPIGSLVTRTVGDVETIAVVYSDGFLMVFGDILKVVLVLGGMFALNRDLSYITLTLLPLMLFLTRFFQKKLKKSFGDERIITSEQNSFVQERLSGMSLIQVFNRKEAEFKKFEEINSRLKKALLKTVFYFSLFFPVVELITSLFISFILLYIGFDAISNGKASIGNVIAFVQFITMLMRPLRQIADRFNNIQRGLIGAERVFSVIDQDLQTPNLGTYCPEKIEGAIEFKGVRFSYDEKQEVLKGIDFKVNPGEKVAVVGATGAGKSTIISLITRFYDVSEGEICLDGKSIYDYELNYLRSNIGVVLQDVFLFHGSIYENLTLGNNDISLQEIKKVAKEIAIDDFIESLPGGYGFVVSERGTSISLGQRQLLSFLRTYLYNPKILILDEATSSVDYESEKLIQQATEKITKGRTSIIIAHRLSTIQNADKIIVMHKGEIVEQGNHEELLSKGMYYALLYKSQFDSEPIACR